MVRGEGYLILTGALVVAPFISGENLAFYYFFLLSSFNLPNPRWVTLQSFNTAILALNSGTYTIQITPLPITYLALL